MFTKTQRNRPQTGRRRETVDIESREEKSDSEAPLYVLVHLVPYNRRLKITCTEVQTGRLNRVQEIQET